MTTVPLGDSITEITCWRSKLWDHLADANATSNIVFVGSMTDNTQNCVATHTNWDHHHEGHSGYLAIDIANSDLTGWLASAKPDVVMFMLGTNDVFQGHATADIITAYTKMVQEMRASNANMKIIVSHLDGHPVGKIKTGKEKGVKQRIREREDDETNKTQKEGGGTALFNLTSWEERRKKNKNKGTEY